MKAELNKSKLKLNKSVTFKTNEDLYYDFALKCKISKNKIADRLNALIAADVVASAPVNTVKEEPVMPNFPETLLSWDRIKPDEEPADASSEN